MVRRLLNVVMLAAFLSAQTGEAAAQALAIMQFVPASRSLTLVLRQGGDWNPNTGLFSDPLPAQSYYITKEIGGHPEFCSLIANDGKLDDYTTVGGKRRGNFRFHIGRISWGCVTVLKSQKDADKLWKDINKILKKTKKGKLKVTIYGKKKRITYYGKMRVLPKKK